MAPRPSDEASDVFAALRAHQSPSMVTGQKFLRSGAVERSSHGAVVLLSDDTSVLDFGSYAVNLLGHGHPTVVAAVQEQLGELAISTRVLANPRTAQLARALADLLGPGLDRVWLGTNGCDAVEAALKLSRLSTGRRTIVAIEGGFHGKTMGALGATHSPRYRTGLEPLLGNVVHIPPDPEAFAEALRTHDVAALVVEPIQAECGVQVIPTPILGAMRRLAADAGAFFVADEVQVGLRRCGPWSIAVADGLEPDAVLLGKPLGGGVLPVSALVCTDALYAPLLQDPFIHTSTFSGYPLGCAAALAALRVLGDEADAIHRLAETFERRLRSLVEAYGDLLAGLRGRGLLWGILTTSPMAAGNLFTEFAQRGLILSPCLGEPEVLRLLPPLVTTDQQLDEAFAIMHASCAATRAWLADA